MTPFFDFVPCKSVGFENFSGKMLQYLMVAALMYDTLNMALSRKEKRSSFIVDLVWKAVQSLKSKVGADSEDGAKESQLENGEEQDKSEDGSDQDEE